MAAHPRAVGTQLAVDVPDGGMGVEDVAALVRRAQQGDADAFGALYRAHVDRIGRYVGALLRDAGRSEEAVAEAFLHAWRDIRQLREPERFVAWLYRIAYRRAMAEARRPRADSLDEAAHVLDERRDASPESAALAAMTAATVRSALLELPDAYREVLVLRHMGELSHREIAQQLGKSEEAVRVAYSRAARALRGQLEQRGDT